MTVSLRNLLSLAGPVVAAALCLSPAVAHAASEGAVSPNSAVYTAVAPSEDGIGKLYMGREIAKVMTYHGADWLERPERVREENPDLVLKALALTPGMAVADIGAGTGYYARRIAQRIGARGVVYAVDIQPEMLSLLEREAAQRGITNVKPVLATAADARLAPGSVDLAVMVDVYHELEYPHEILEQIVRALKPGGRVAFVEFRADEVRVPIKRLHTMSEQQVRREASVHALEWVKTVSDLPWQHVIVFRRR